MTDPQVQQIEGHIWDKMLKSVTAEPQPTDYIGVEFDTTTYL